MNTKVRLSSVLIIFAVCVLIFSVFQSQASAKIEIEEALTVNPSRCDLAGAQAAAIPGGPGFVSIPGTAFTQMTDVPPHSYSNILYNPSTGFTGAYAAAVLLPQGATVNKLVVYYYDESTANLDVNLYRIELGSSSVNTMANAPSQSNMGFGAMIDTTIDYNIVDNQSYAYFARVTIPVNTYGHLGLIGIRVDYTFPSYLPCVTR